MKTDIYTDAPREIEEAMEAAVPVDPWDIFPPEFFIERLGKEKVTINLDKVVVNSFRDYAKAHGVKYQSLINEVLRHYVETQLGA